MFGPPCRRPPGDILLRQFWTYVIKLSGKSKSINACDGYCLTGKGVHYTKHYSACASQQGFNIFIALSTSLGYILMAAGDINAYAQEPPPEEPFYMYICMTSTVTGTVTIIELKFYWCFSYLSIGICRDTYILDPFMSR